MRTRLVLFLCCLCLVGSAADADKPSMNATVTEAELDAQIKTAIEKGTNYLRKRHDGHGFFEGEFKAEIGSAALAVCALRKAGVPPDQEVIQKVLNRIHAYADRASFDSGYTTYNVSLCLMALDAAQHAEYPGTTQSPEKQTKTSAEKLTAILIRDRGPRGGWIYSGRGDGDLSNSQYGILGLWSATRLGVKIPKELWPSIANYVMTVHQQGNGGFTYLQRGSGDSSTVSMSVAGISTLALAYREAQGNEIARERPPVGDDTAPIIGLRKAPLPTAKMPMAEVELAIDRAFKWWEKSDFAVTDAYCWYAAERACTLTNTQRLNGKPWFSALARFILPFQNADGSWMQGRDVTCDTAWALLALTRSTQQMVRMEDDYEKAERLANEKRGVEGTKK